MKPARTKPLGKRQREEIDRLAKRPESGIDTSDIPELKNLKGAVVGKFYRPIKRAVTIRLDSDVIEWFKSRGGRYQTEVNRVLRTYVGAQRKSRP